MSIDFSSIEPFTDWLLMNLIKVLGIPLIFTFVVGFVLKALKVPRGIIVPVVILLFFWGVYQMFIRFY